MQLVADRFVRRRGSADVDLATGLRVRLRVSAMERASEVEWTARCDTFARLRHPLIAPLVDYGAVGRGQRFEAWQCGPAWDGAEREAANVRASVAQFLAATGIAASDGQARVHVRHGVPVVVPSLDGPPVEPRRDVEIDTMPLAARGVLLPDAAPLAALAELFRGVDGPRLRAAAVWGPPGSGRGALLLQLARLARINGFVPVATSLVGSAAAPLWHGRSLLLIDTDGRDAWPAIVAATLASPLPHALLVVGEKEEPAVDGVALRPLASDQLAGAVRPTALTPSLEHAVRRAAEQAGGWPGRFVELLRGGRCVAASARAAAPRPRAAEQTAVYGGDERAAVTRAPHPPVTWPLPGELASLRRRVDEATRQLAAGRHAPGTRALRQAVAALARRDAWADAAAAGLALARVLLRRGQVREVESVVRDVRLHADRADDRAALLEAAVIAGEMWIDRVRLDEAESVLTAAVTSASALDDRPAAARASLAMARCLFWRGRYDAAFAIAERVEDTGRDVCVRRQRRLAAIAAARGDVPMAMRLATDLVASCRGGQASDLAAALETAALVSLAAGDGAAAGERAREAVDAARGAHDPLRAVRARILLAEADRRNGAVSTDAPRLRRLVGRLPPLVQAWLDPRAHAPTLPPLALLIAPDLHPSQRSGLPVVDHMIAIVRACQTAEDEQTVLQDVCARVRQQLWAASVAFVTGSGDRAAVLAVDGVRADVDAACRAIDAGIVIAPHRHDDRVVAAAPIQYAGVTVGALVARWALGSTGDRANAAAVLATTAVAAAPIVSAALAHRARVVAAAGRELLGVAPSMDEVRRLIARAASAPFPVLIAGESGSGKELVAQAIHRGSTRRDRTFRTLNCAAIPDDLAEAELFGHVRGSFTGAIGDRTGVFEEAHGGTLFLDEVGELTPRAQAKLLRVLQEGEIRRVGESVARRVDVRIVAATNRDLRAECEAGRFRLDLFYRLDVIRVALPALRERAEDVPMLAEHFWREATARINSRATLSASTVAALARYPWPGNVRELQNVLAALAVRCPKRGVVPPSALPPSFAAPQGSPAWRLEEARRLFEERFVRAALARSGGHRARAAAELGVSRQGLTKLMSRLGIS